MAEPVTRRRLLRNAAVVTAAASLPAGAAHSPTAQAAPNKRRRRRQRVAVLGGGIGGLTAAHELAERGFHVTVYERRRTFGGKARSIDVPHSAADGRRPLPGEHGARFFAGFYSNLPDTMRRIGTYEHLLTAPQERYARGGGREDFNANFALTRPYPWTLEQFRQSLVGALDIATHLPPHEIAYFTNRLIVFFASCDARRLGQWERMSWWDYVDAERFSEDYRRMLVSSVTRFILGSKADEASARTLGLLWEAGTYTQADRGNDGSFDRVLDGPTNDVLIDPWVRQLEKQEVRFKTGTTIERLYLRDGRIRAARARRGKRHARIEADWFVCALPVERARRLWTRPIRKQDPQLANTKHLETRWMNGLQFFLKEPAPIVRGHVLYIDSPWAIVSISQAQFWPGDFTERYGDGRARECLSAVISDFNEPGVVYGRPARELTPDEIARDAWQQLKDHLNDTAGDKPLLRDDMLLSWFVDPALTRTEAGRMRNEEPLFISTPGAWENRPGAATKIPNLMLAADYVRVNIDTASMEGANEAGRRAANAILDASSSREQPAQIFDLYKPPEFEPLRRVDEEAWARGLPNAFDTSAASPVPLPPRL